MDYIYKDATYKIIGAAQEVPKELGLIINLGEPSLKVKRIIL
jgi:hypothetical protein